MIAKTDLFIQLQYELARRDFWEYCKLRAPDFYKESRTYLKEFCYQLQAFYESDKKVLVVNMPPRHGKSRTLGLFTEWLFGKDNHNKVMTGSYNETLSTTFAKRVRDTISEEDGLFSKIFPSTKIKYGEASMSKWKLEGNEEANYLATSPGGTATGFGCLVMILDDTIKGSAEAYNANYIRKINDWFTDTMLSRTEHGFKIIAVMTRWVSDDLAGFILENYADSLVHISYKAIQEDGSMLCDEVLNKEDFLFKTRKMSKEIVAANYNQEPMDLEGRLYRNLKTYTEIPKDSTGKPLFKYILNYTDTADTGDDYLCSICYGMYEGSYYILDVYYTKESMEITEPATAEMLIKNNVGTAMIESNNGGRGFARNVESECRKKGNKHIVIHSFYQGENKQARIFSNSNSVMTNVLFPINWMDRWPEFADHILRYQKEGKNEHDDAEDCLTGVYENPEPKGNWLV
jgi:predicted phage terminase large subunit-like protein